MFLLVGFQTGLAGVMANQTPPDHHFTAGNGRWNWLG